MISGAEIEAVWSVVGKIAVIVGALVAIVQGFKYLMSLMPVSKLEQRIKDCEEYDKNMDVRVGSLEKQINGIGQEMDLLTEGIQRIGKSQISLLRHFVTGNGQQEMEDEANDLTEFFIDRR